MTDDGVDMKGGMEKALQTQVAVEVDRGESFCVRGNPPLWDFRNRGLLHCPVLSS